MYSTTHKPYIVQSKLIIYTNQHAVIKHIPQLIHYYDHKTLITGHGEFIEAVATSGGGGGKTSQDLSGTARVRLSQLQVHHEGIQNVSMARVILAGLL